MESMSVQTARLSQLSSDISLGASGIQEVLTQLESSVKLLGSQWSGEAQKSYNDAQVAWTNSITAMQQLLTDIATSTEVIAQGYQAADKQSASYF